MTFAEFIDELWCGLSISCPKVGFLAPKSQKRRGTKWPFLQPTDGRRAKAAFFFSLFVGLFPKNKVEP
jgi:hypothetical protein